MLLLFVMITPAPPRFEPKTRVVEEGVGIAEAGIEREVVEGEEKGLVEAAEAERT